MSASRSLCGSHADASDGSPKPSPTGRSSCDVHSLDESMLTRMMCKAWGFPRSAIQLFLSVVGGVLRDDVVPHSQLQESSANAGLTAFRGSTSGRLRRAGPSETIAASKYTRVQAEESGFRVKWRDFEAGGTEPSAAVSCEGRWKQTHITTSTID